MHVSNQSVEVSLGFIRLPLCLSVIVGSEFHDAAEQQTYR